MGLEGREHSDELMEDGGEQMKSIPINFHYKGKGDHREDRIVVDLRMCV